MSNQRDYESGFSRFERQGGPNPSFDMPIFQGRFPFSSSREGGDPRYQGFCEFLKEVFCPKLKWSSFTCYIVIINVAVFIFTCYQGINKEGSFLQIDHDVLLKVGNLPIAVYQKKQIWRWLSACFLHADFMHLFFNSVSILIVGSMIERAQGGVQTAIVYIVSGVAGNIFSSLVGSNPEIVGVGASTCIYGIIASLVGFMILNWDAMAPYKTNRNYIMCVLCMIIALVVFMSMGPSDGGESQLDYNGHLGGFIGGFFFSLCIFTPFQKTSYEQKTRFVGWTLGLFYVFMMILLFFTTKFSQ